MNRALRPFGHVFGILYRGLFGGADKWWAWFVGYGAFVVAKLIAATSLVGVEALIDQKGLVIALVIFDILIFAAGVAYRRRHLND